MEIDIAKLSPATQQRLIAFSEAIEEQAYSTGTVTERLSPFTDETWTHEECPIQIVFHALDCREALKQCPEPEIKELVDQIDAIKILDSLQDKATSEEYTKSYHEIRRVEKILSELGWKCKNHLK